MKIITNKPHQRGFGLKELLFGLTALAIAAHYYAPTLEDISKETTVKVGTTKESVHELFRPGRF